MPNGIRSTGPCSVCSTSALSSKSLIKSVGYYVAYALIKLFDDKADVEQTEHGPVLRIPFGTKLPFDHSEVLHAVGNAANAAVNFSKLGLESALVSNVGGDGAGRDILSTLDKLDVDTRFVHINPRKMSNYHYILWYKEERTILIKHEEYKYRWPHLRAKEIPRWIYFSSISKNAMEFHDDIVEWLHAHPDICMKFHSILANRAEVNPTGEFPWLLGEANGIYIPRA